jgi:hypothetical protein
VKRFAPIRLHHRQPAPRNVVPWIRISCDDLFPGACWRHDSGDKLFHEKPLSIIFENDAVDFVQHFRHASNNGVDLPFIWRQNLLPVDPNHLLLPRNDAGLDDGGKIRCDGTGGSIDLLVGQ